MSILRILGCSGGIGGACRTTSFLIDKNTLIDAGTGVADLSLSELCLVDQVFLTHAHLDHIACLPLLADAVGVKRQTPIRVYALPGTLEALRQYIFNNVIWPDFTKIEIKGFPILELIPIELGDTLSLPAGLTMTALPATHSIPACGYAVRSDTGCLIFTGDTWANDELWVAVNALPNVDHLIIETSFCNALDKLADVSMHLTPDKLARELSKLQHCPRVHITHIKPGMEQALMAEINATPHSLVIQPLSIGETLSF